MRIYNTMLIASLCSALLAGCGERSDANVAEKVRMLQTGQVDYREYTEADFSSGLEAVVARETGAEAARVLSLGNLYYAAIRYPNGTQAADDRDVLERAGFRLRDMLGMRATDIHVSSDPNAYDKLDELARRMQSGGIVSSFEVFQFMEDWRNHSVNAR